MENWREFIKEDDSDLKTSFLQDLEDFYKDPHDSQEDMTAYASNWLAAKLKDIPPHKLLTWTADYLVGPGVDLWNEYFMGDFLIKIRTPDNEKTYSEFDFGVDLFLIFLLKYPGAKFTAYAVRNRGILLYQQRLSKYIPGGAAASRRILGLLAKMTPGVTTRKSMIALLAVLASEVGLEALENTLIKPVLAHLSSKGSKTEITLTEKEVQAAYNEVMSTTGEEPEIPQSLNPTNKEETAMSLP